jgi:hypothetical protein
MAFEAKIGITFHEQLAIDRAMGTMANGAAFAQRLVFEHKRSALIAVTRGAILVEPGHGQPAGRFENIAAMRIVALHTIHARFQHRMMLRQTEFSVGLQMTLETGSGIFAGIDDEFSASAPGLDVFAAGPVAGFATGLAGQFSALEMNARMRAGGKDARDIRVAIVAGFIADIIRAGNFGGGQNRSRESGTGIKQTEHASNYQQANAREPAPAAHNQPRNSFRRRSGPAGDVFAQGRLHGPQSKTPLPESRSENSLAFLQAGCAACLGSDRGQGFGPGMGLPENNAEPPGGGGGGVMVGSPAKAAGTTGMRQQPMTSAARPVQVPRRHRGTNRPPRQW